MFSRVSTSVPRVAVPLAMSTFTASVPPSLSQSARSVPVPPSRMSLPARPISEFVAAEPLDVVRSEGPGQCLAVRGSIDRVEAGVVVLDQATGRGRAEDGAVGRAGEGDQKALVGLDLGVAVHADRAASCWPRRRRRRCVPEGSTPLVKSAALAGLAPVPVTAQATECADREVARAGDGEAERRLAARPLVEARGGGARSRSRGAVVVADQAIGRGRAEDGAVGRAGQGDQEALVGLDLGVAVDADGQRLAGLAGGEGDRCRRAARHW